MVMRAAILTHEYTATTRVRGPSAENAGVATVGPSAAFRFRGVRDTANARPLARGSIPRNTRRC